jgi:hypothetical protein
MSKYIPVEPEKWAAMVRAWADNARLQAEVDRLTAFTTRTIIPNEELEAENARLKAEVERLTKAGDAMAFELEPSLKYNPLSEDIRYQVCLWLAAKEGKQSE